MEAPKINETWHVRYGEAIGKEYNILVRIDEDKKELKPPNWRKNRYKCEHKGSEIYVDGEMMIEKFN